MKLFALFILCVAVFGFCAGCQTGPEAENASERPWNGQRGWEHGLPAGINQGR